MSAMNRGFIVVVFCSLSMQAQAFGDLFTSTLQRQAIDAMRERGGVEMPTMNREPNTLTINGFYYKGHDKREKGVVWVNGQQAKQGEKFNGITVKKLNESDQTVNVTVGDSGRSVPFKAGQTMYLDDHKIVDAYQ
ncbi:hypothetical protein A9Q82_00150 [Cycloclasticus sp. 46_120_T64]|nr:hypothetical protein A9Q82_00150 [Cycloclasticus sp. 46_120_T64]